MDLSLDTSKFGMFALSSAGEGWGEEILKTELRQPHTNETPRATTRDCPYKYR